MHTQGSNCLKGPVSGARQWWSRWEDSLLDEEIPSLDDPDIRADLVRRVRREIAAGTYETPEKLAAALDRLLEELQG